MSFRRGLPKLLGKTITGYAVTHANREPRYQIFLEFDDGTTYEIYSEAVICGAGELDQADIDDVIGKFKECEVDLTRKIDPREEPLGPQRKLFKE